MIWIYLIGPGFAPSALSGPGWEIRWYPSFVAAIAAVPPATPSSDLYYLCLSPSPFTEYNVDVLGGRVFTLVGEFPLWNLPVVWWAPSLNPARPLRYFLRVAEQSAVRVVGVAFDSPGVDAFEYLLPSGNHTAGGVIRVEDYTLLLQGFFAQRTGPPHQNWVTPELGFLSVTGTESYVEVEDFAILASDPADLANHFNYLFCVEEGRCSIFNGACVGWTGMGPWTPLNIVGVFCRFAASVRLSQCALVRLTTGAVHDCAQPTGSQFFVTAAPPGAPFPLFDPGGEIPFGDVVRVHPLMQVYTCFFLECNGALEVFWSGAEATSLGILVAGSLFSYNVVVGWWPPLHADPTLTADFNGFLLQFPTAFGDHVGYGHRALAYNNLAYLTHRAVEVHGYLGGASVRVVNNTFACGQNNQPAVAVVLREHPMSGDVLVQNNVISTWAPWVPTGVLSVFGPFGLGRGIEINNSFYAPPSYPIAGLRLLGNCIWVGTVWVPAPNIPLQPIPIHIYTRVHGIPPTDTDVVEDFAAVMPPNVFVNPFLQLQGGVPTSLGHFRPLGWGAVNASVPATVPLGPPFIPLRDLSLVSRTAPADRGALES